jgi:cytochrome d ubiquinol oxidase subunit II
MQEKDLNLMGLDYPSLQIIWWGLIGLTLIIYACTAGFDFGVTLLLPFIRNENERRVLINTIGPTWDGNQTWLVFAGGALFVIWPVVYGTIFSGLYTVMLFILWSFFMRPPGFDYRGKISNQTWRSFWDWALFISAFFPVLMFGLIFGNLLVGLPIYFDPFDLRSYYDGNFFGLFSPFTCLCALASLFLITMHGAAYLVRRTEDQLRAHCKRLHATCSLIFIIIFATISYKIGFDVSGYHLVSSPINPTEHPLDNQVTQSVGAWLASYKQQPWKFIPPLLVYIGVTISVFTNESRNRAIPFWGSVLAVGATVATAGATLFPFLIPSSIKPAESLTVWNATSAPYTLQGMLIVAIVMFSIILTYKIFSYWTIWHKQKSLKISDILEEKEEYY